jgi:hypothetical protein
MTIQTKHNKVITVSGEVLKTFITIAIYVGIAGTVVVGMLWLGVTLGEWVHDILN